MIWKILVIQAHLLDPAVVDEIKRINFNFHFFLNVYGQYFKSNSEFAFLTANPGCMHPKDLSINDFDYFLPPEKIAIFPLEERDQSKLLIYKNGTITEDILSPSCQSFAPENFSCF